MARRAHRHSIFSQSLDRAVFLAYFLGAVVPFVALAFVVNAFVLPAVAPGVQSQGLVALTLSVGALSAGSFLVLRRTTWQTVATMGRDNRRLAALLETSEQLVTATHDGEIAARLASCAQHLADARATFVVAAPEGDAPPKCVARAGDEGIFGEVQERLSELLEPVLASGRPALWGSDGRSGADLSGGSARVAAVPVEGLGALVAVASRARGLEAADLSSLSTLGAMGSVTARNARLRDAQRNFFVHVTDMLVAALDAHMDVQSGHARRVAYLANQIGRALGLPEELRQRLHFAALLHDVGMLRIHPMRQGERSVYRQHPTLGFKMLAPIQLWQDIAPIVLHHHEWFDGSGYPDALAGDAIPVEARIIGLAEAFDSMTSAASYKEPVPRDEALRRVEAGSGTQFDPDVVGAFLGLVSRGELQLG